MINHRAILLYYSKGNNNTQIATICGCSRPAVIRTIKRAKEINLQIPVSDSISDKELFVMLNPSRGRNKQYYMPDWYELNKDKIKRSFTKFRAWQKYCRVAKKLGLKAYGKTRFYKFYFDYFNTILRPRAKTSKVLSQIMGYEIARDSLVLQFGINSQQAQSITADMERWCKSLKLDMNKIWVT